MPNAKRPLSVATCIKTILLLTFINACQSPSPDSSNTPKQTAPTATAANANSNQGNAVGTSEIGEPLYEKDYETTKSGKRVRRSAMGVTIRFPDGWKKEDMDFQIDYCKQTMASVQTIDSQKFCTCFLEKVQYYYEPIYVRDSYEHQQHWNQECFAAAQK